MPNCTVETITLGKVGRRTIEASFDGGDISSDAGVLLLRQGGGFRRELRVGTELAAIVGACDGELSLGAIVVAVAELLEVDLAELRRTTVAEARDLLVDGILLVGSGG